MVALPWLIPVTKPSETVATDSLLLDQRTVLWLALAGETVAVRVVVPVTGMVAELGVRERPLTGMLPGVALGLGEALGEPLGLAVGVGVSGLLTGVGQAVKTKARTVRRQPARDSLFFIVTSKDFSSLSYTTT
jgi:hypothetical protein